MLFWAVGGCKLTEAQLFIPLPDEQDDDDDGDDEEKDGGDGDDTRPPRRDAEVADGDAGNDPDDLLDPDSDASIAIGPGGRCAIGDYTGEIRCRVPAIVFPLTGTLSLTIAREVDGGVANVRGSVTGTDSDSEELFDHDVRGRYDCETGDIRIRTEPFGGTRLPLLSWTVGGLLQGQYDPREDSFEGPFDIPGAPDCEGTWSAGGPTDD